MLTKKMMKNKKLKKQKKDQFVWTSFDVVIILFFSYICMLAYYILWVFLLMISYSIYIGSISMCVCVQSECG